MSLSPTNGKCQNAQRTVRTCLGLSYLESSALLGFAVVVLASSDPGSPSCGFKMTLPFRSTPMSKTKFEPWFGNAMLSPLDDF